MALEDPKLETIEPTGNKAVDRQRSDFNKRALKVITVAGNAAEFGTLAIGGTIKLGIKATRGLINGLAS